MGRSTRCDEARGVKVLVTGGGALLGQGIIRSLRQSTLSPEIVAVDPSPLAVGLQWADRSHAVPLASAPQYLDVFLGIIADERPDAILVGTDVELEVLSRARAMIEKDFETHVVVSSTEVIRIADDKYATAEFFRQAGLPHPRSALPDGARELARDIGYPLVVKPRQGARSVGVEVVHDDDELARALDGKDGLLVQECVGTDEVEFTAGVICFDGRCDASIVMRRDLRDGNTYRAFVDEYPELNEQVRTFAERLGPEGPANFQFRLVDGQAKVFEINARFSGTTPFRALAGFNEVEMVLRHVLYGEAVRQPRIEPMTILRYWTEQVVRGRQSWPNA